MGLAMPQLLQPGVVNRTISELDVHNTRLTHFFEGGGGEASGGGTAASDEQSGRNFAWDVYNDSREVEGGRVPGTPPSRIDPNPVGNVQGKFPRVHASLPLLHEQIHNQRTLGTVNIDRGGQNFILRQERYLKQRFSSHKEMQWAGMLRGAYYYTREGDDMKVSLSSGSKAIDFQVPAGNKAKLDMLGEGDILAATWSNTATDIHTHLVKVNRAMEILTGRALRHVWINSFDFGYVLRNTVLQAMSGTANITFDRYDRIGNENDLIAVMRAIPWVTWHITDAVLSLSGTLTPLIPSGYASFLPNVDPTWVGVGKGSEIVTEYPGAKPTERFDEYFWAEPTTKPSGYELIGVMNRLPFPYVPSCIALGNIVY